MLWQVCLMDSKQKHFKMLVFFNDHSKGELTSSSYTVDIKQWALAMPLTVCGFYKYIYKQWIFSSPKIM